MTQQTIENANRFTDQWHCHLCGYQLLKNQNCGGMEVEEVFFALDIPNRVETKFLQFHVVCINREFYH